MPEKTIKKTVKIIIKVILVCFILLFLGGCLFFWGLKAADLSEVERKLVFKPTNQTYELIPELSSNTEKGSFLSDDGTKITYMRIKGQKSFPVIVFCHGNEKSMTNINNQDKLKFLTQSGYEVFALDYRGYGDSKGIPSEEGVYSDINAFISYLNKEYNIPEQDIVLWGHSLGSAIAINEATKRNFKGVIIEGAFTSIEDMREHVVNNERKSDPVSLLIRDYIYNSIKITQKFLSKEKISAIKSPMLIVHAIHDEQVPYSMGKKLSEIKPDAQTYFSETGGHCDSGWQDRPVLEFIKGLR